MCRWGIFSQKGIFLKCIFQNWPMSMCAVGYIFPTLFGSLANVNVCRWGIFSQKGIFLKCIFQNCIWLSGRCQCVQVGYIFPKGYFSKMYFSKMHFSKLHFFKLYLALWPMSICPC